MARALDVLKKIGRVLWYLSGVGLLVLIVRRWVLMGSMGTPQPYKPADITYHPEPDTAGMSEADKAEALRRKLDGLR